MKILNIDQLNTNYTKVLLHFDEPLIKDECDNEWTIIGTPSLSTINAKYNKAFTNTDINISYIYTQLELGGDDFTIDFYGYMDNKTGQYGAFFSSMTNLSVGRAGQFNFGRHSTYNSLEISTWNESGSFYSAFDKEVNNTNIINSLHHYAVEYIHSYSILNIYIDSRLVNSIINTVFNRSLRYFAIGYNLAFIPYGLTSGGEFIGSISEFRISDRIARYANFNPPNKQYLLD